MNNELGYFTTWCSIMFCAWKVLCSRTSNEEDAALIYVGSAETLSVKLSGRTEEGLKTIKCRCHQVGPIWVLNNSIV